MHILICCAADQRYAFDLASVDRAILAIETFPIPNAPKYITGAINVHGEIIPVFSLRELLNHEHKELEINDQFVILKKGNQKLALWVDKVEGVQACSSDALISGENFMPHLKTIRYVYKEADAITLILDLDTLIPDFAMT